MIGLNGVMEWGIAAAAVVAASRVKALSRAFSNRLRDA